MFNPAIENSKEIMNTVKKREYFRPFAASVMEDKAREYFDMPVESSPYMMAAFPALEDKKAEIPGVVHEDGTTRVQTVSSGKYYEVIKEFYEVTGIPMVMNTSFNLAGEPLVETVEEALNTLTGADFQYLYLADKDILISKLKDNNE